MTVKIEIKRNRSSLFKFSLLAMASKAKKLRDVSSVDFSVMNQQCIPVEIGNCPSRISSSSTASMIQTGRPLMQTWNGKMDELLSRPQRPASTYANGVVGGYPRSMMQSSPSVDSSLVLETGSVRGRAALSSKNDSRLLQIEHSGVRSSDEGEPLVEEELLLSEDDTFVTAMSLVETRLGSDAASSIITTEADRRWEDYEAALNQHHCAKFALKQLSEQRSANTQICHGLMAEIESVKAQVLSINEELDRREVDSEELERDRHSIDTMYQIAQLRLAACNRAMENLPEGYGMNIAFNEEIRGPEAVSQPVQPDRNDRTFTPGFDAASVSSSEVGNC